MADESDRPPTDDPALSRLSAALAGLPKNRLPPVERWNPDSCGSIDIRIGADGTWHHNGTPIRREKLVRLFSTILRREPDGSTVLVTPAEKLTIAVDDAAFAAVEMAVEGEAEARSIAFRTNVDDLVRVDSEHPLRFEDGDDGFRPYVHVRRDLWARLTRPLAYALAELAEERAVEDGTVLGIAAGGDFHVIGPAPHE
ncbi:MULTISPECIES: DUF1285 domain-containing protein [Methylobacterium]|uniref:DUF1285 domain-containing protein n=1 Tax=Methylobacterium jeotgali TaxID=381630 RepID=A0ABQ4SNL1_9HYPH|nr:MULTISPECIES: DUF1285 domain-containing protein [Methylobacterium]PIU04719.1 MAG: DUF1285 domain-containing protein [Methylobacterium sp. CG09_land_8_20_14_0_10_71_15]PIU13422.1 MAG: DUF1285 domain-containing protein [Methylobacterium sp. CG08_land_8_20_14_0_20_71_15]GBU18474.1 hypothetical protein AwMethylo_26890 [Methylobacterium sp.]GJE04811.1 hypothetical protein AOPFMNJM_0103 [Methylobacterium jeotgali]